MQKQATQVVSQVKIGSKILIRRCIEYKQKQLLNFVVLFIGILRLDLTVQIDGIHVFIVSQNSANQLVLRCIHHGQPTCFAHRIWNTVRTHTFLCVNTVNGTSWLLFNQNRIFQKQSVALDCLSLGPVFSIRNCIQQIEVISCPLKAHLKMAASKSLLMMKSRVIL